MDVLLPPPYSTFDHTAMELVDSDSMTATMTLDHEEVHDAYNGQVLALSNTWRLNDDDLHNLFQVSRDGDLSSLVLPMLHLASNNALPEEKAAGIVNSILSGNSRRLFNTLISTQSPATQAIARSLLPEAINSQDVELVRSLLGTGINPDSPMDYWRHRPLQLAVRKGDMLMTRLLLDYEAHVNLPWAGLWETPLCIAARDGRLDLVQLLLGSGANVDDRTSTRSSTPLQIAARYDKFEIVQLLLSAGADVSAPADGTLGQTALQGAAGTGNMASVQALLFHSVKANAIAFEYNSTALQSAASAEHLELVEVPLMCEASDVLSAMENASQHGHIHIVQALMWFGIGLDDSSHEAYKQVALIAGARCGDHLFVQQLLDTGKMDVDASPIECDANCTTALQAAVESGHISLIQLLMTSGANINAPGGHLGHPHISHNRSCGRTALQLAARSGNVELVRLLLNAGADVEASSSCGVVALVVAAFADNLEIVQLLLDHGANTFEHGAAALIAVIQCRGSPELVQLLLTYVECSGVAGYVEEFEYRDDYCIDRALMWRLLEHGVLRENSAMKFAIWHSELELVELILGFGIDVDGPELVNAVSCGELEIMQLLLKYKPSTKGKAQALQSAAHHGDIEFVNELICAGADVSAAPLGYFDEDNVEQWRTALQAAAQHGHLEVVQLLLEKGAEVERQTISKDEEGTALQFAAISGSISIVNELAQKGANVNARAIGKEGRTALEGAAEHGRLDMVQLLLNLEADIRGSRALQFARNEGHDGVAMLLLKNGFEDVEDDFNMSD